MTSYDLFSYTLLGVTLVATVVGLLAKRRIDQALALEMQAEADANAVLVEAKRERKSAADERAAAGRHLLAATRARDEAIKALAKATKANELTVVKTVRRTRAAAGTRKKA